MKTNITDVMISTPSLQYDPQSDRLNCFYYYRGRGVLNRRSMPAKEAFRSPLNWSAPETVAIGSRDMREAGNVNGLFCGGSHILAYYSGTMPDIGIYILHVK